MADREEVIKGLEKAWDAFNHMEHELYADYVYDALELLKEQEPKPVKVTKNAYNYEFYHCPNCGRSFDLTYYKKPAYCDKCG